MITRLLQLPSMEL